MLPKFLLPAVLVFAAGIIFSPSLKAQSGASLEAEIQNLERAAARQGVSPAERHEALVRLARLRQLSGNIEGAARAWLDAAGAIPGRVDDEALLNCAYCLAAMGEWDRAATALEPLLSRYPRARFLDTGIKAINSGDTFALAAIVDNPEYSEMKSEILYLLWKLSQGTSAERWRQRIVTEFPNSPEGRLAAGGSPSIIVRPSPFWLFLSGRETIAQMENTARDTSQIAPQIVPQAAPAPQPSQSASSQSAPQTAKTPMPQVQTAPQPAQTTPQSEPQSAPQAAKAPVSASRADTARLQTGIFTREDNARTQIENLRKAGFTSALERRIVNGNEMWAVIVPAGADANRTMNDLKKSGFDSFVLK